MSYLCSIEVPFEENIILKLKEEQTQAESEDGKQWFNTAFEVRTRKSVVVFVVTLPA